MCKGVAILINDKEILMNPKNSFHSHIVANVDNYLKINVVFDNTKKEGYRIEVDKHSEEQIKIYKKKCFLTPTGKIINSYLKRLKEFCKEHEAEIFRLFASGLLQSAKFGYQDNSSAEFGDQNNYSAKFGNQYNSSAKFDYQNNSFAEFDNQDNSFAEFDNQNNYSAKFGDQNNFSAKFGNQNNSYAELKNIFIKNMTIKDSKKCTELIKEFSESTQDKYTLTNFIEWLLKNKKR